MKVIREQVTRDELKVLKKINKHQFQIQLWLDYLPDELYETITKQTGISYGAWHAMSDFLESCVVKKTE
jgi:hypothetical protein